jgi:hypothetical protein
LWPRVSIGGGALSGKDLTHIDRAAACAARQACVEAVHQGAQDAHVCLTYAPGLPEPLDVAWSFSDGGRPPQGVRFDFSSITEVTRGASRSLRESGRGDHFFDLHHHWNNPIHCPGTQ